MNSTIKKRKGRGHSAKSQILIDAARRILEDIKTESKQSIMGYFKASISGLGRKYSEGGAA